jgi:hypothetical protein
MARGRKKSTRSKAPRAPRVSAKERARRAAISAGLLAYHKRQRSIERARKRQRKERRQGQQRKRERHENRTRGAVMGQFFLELGELDQWINYITEDTGLSPREIYTLAHSPEAV